jgi:cobalt/nickel transport protein
MKVKEKVFIVIIAIAAIFIGLFLSPLASKYPDGLEKVAEKLGFADKATNIVNFKFIIPDYSFPGIKSSFWQTSLAGFFGVLIVLTIFVLIYLIILFINKNKNLKNKN